MNVLTGINAVVGSHSFQIRKAKISDFQVLAALDRVVWSDNDHSTYIPDGEHAWRIWVEHAVVFCAVVDEKAIGASIAFPCLNSIWCLHKIFVSADFRSHGIASSLLATTLKQIDAMQVGTFLTVDPNNPKAITLYEKFGFELNEVVKGYYRSHEDRLLMRRRLQSNLPLEIS